MKALICGSRSWKCSDEHWLRYGKRAGFLRNLAMLNLGPDLVVAFSNGSSGTQLTIDAARERGIPVEIIGKEAAR